MPRAALVAFALVLTFARPVAAQKVESIDGYAEYLKNGALVVDGQRIAADGATRFRGDASRGLDAIPLGAEVKVRGTRRGDGSILAHSIEAKQNGVGLLERSLRDQADAAERQWLRAGEIEDPDDPDVGGRVFEDGRYVSRARRILDRVVPPYLDARRFRVYVVDNKDWNAFAMPNGSVWVFTGLMHAMDDDELAVVMGHELAHITHEHSRRTSKKSIFTSVVAAAAGLAAEMIEDDTVRTAVQATSFVTALAVDSGFGRQAEDQADRVGLRYAFEGGFDVRKAPGVWQKFENQYGSGNRVVNFFLSGHSRAPVRRDHLRRQISWNYQPGVDVSLAAAQPATAARPEEVVNDRDPVRRRRRAPAADRDASAGTSSAKALAINAKLETKLDKR